MSNCTKYQLYVNLTDHDDDTNVDKNFGATIVINKLN